MVRLAGPSTVPSVTFPPAVVKFWDAPLSTVAPVTAMEPAAVVTRSPETVVAPV
ncbi:MAG: hypothetical protein GIKADHBN_03244 [Phycisphaerales bacterium]|nr:hypothetical protein [Phycisphaerales bacterium]